MQPETKYRATFDDGGCGPWREFMSVACVDLGYGGQGHIETALVFVREEELKLNAGGAGDVPRTVASGGDGSTAAAPAPISGDGAPAACAATEDVRTSASPDYSCVSSSETSPAASAEKDAAERAISGEVSGSNPDSRSSLKPGTAKLLARIFRTWREEGRLLSHHENRVIETFLCEVAHG